MSRWNHFAIPKYATIKFSDVGVGEKFRRDLFKNKRRRSAIIMIKTGELSYKEQKSGVEETVFHNNFEVYSFDILNHTHTGKQSRYETE